MAVKYSVSPTGEKFPLPAAEDYRAEFERIQQLVAEQRKLGREIVVVMGVGFVGAVMAAIVADTVDRAPMVRFWREDNLRAMRLGV